jgi:LPS O-antigen subunit length determinant protein (WzzB/FepE family)
VGKCGAEGGKEMTEEDDINYYRRMFWGSLWWSAAIVVAFALFALLA